MHQVPGKVKSLQPSPPLPLLFWSLMLFITIPVTSPRPLLGEAIVLSEKSIKAVRLPNKSIKRQEAFQNDIICYAGGNK